MAIEITEQIFVGQVSQKVVIERDGKVLISRDKGAVNWDLPGGRIHIGENPINGLVREVKEEIGVEVQVGQPFHTDVFTFSSGSTKSPGTNCYIVAYRATLADSAKPFELAADEIDEVKWLTREEIDSIPMWDEYKRTLKAFFESK